MDPLLRDIAVLVGLFGPAGLIGYVWRSAVWKTRLEARLNRLEEHERNQVSNLKKIERVLSERKRECSETHRELRDLLREEIRRVEAIMLRRRADVFTEKE